MIAQNIQSYRKETRNTDTSLCSCTHRAVTPGPGTKGTRANSVLESASSRPPGHQSTVNIKPLQRCCFHMGHRSHRATRPVSSGDKFWAPWRQDSNPSSLGGILQASTAHQGYHRALPEPRLHVSLPKILPLSKPESNSAGESKAALK